MLAVGYFGRPLNALRLCLSFPKGPKPGSFTEKYLSLESSETWLREKRCHQQISLRSTADHASCLPGSQSEPWHCLPPLSLLQTQRGVKIAEKSRSRESSLDLFLKNGIGLRPGMLGNQGVVPSAQSVLERKHVEREESKSQSYLPFLY